MLTLTAVRKHFYRYEDKSGRLREALDGVLVHQFDLDRKESEPIIDLMLASPQRFS